MHDADNGKLDLRKAADRKRLIERTKMTLGSFIEIHANIYRSDQGTLEGFENHHLGPIVKNKAELLLILDDLDFQIETGDLVDG